VETPHGLEAYGVLLAPSWELWRARILTYPRSMWCVPGGSSAVKFVGRTPIEAERRAVDFIREHCRARGYLMRDEAGAAQPARTEATAGPIRLQAPAGPPAERKERFVWVRFGLAEPTESGKTGNLSETGLFVITDSPVQQGHWLDLMLETEDDAIPLQGEVRWMRISHHAGRAPGMGIQLQTPPPSYIDYVRAIG